KLMQTMIERDDTKPLAGIVQLDDAYWGGERHGGSTGRGSPGKTPFVAAVQITAQGFPMAMRMDVVPGFRKTALAQWAQRHLAPGTAVVSDGLNCFPGVTAADCTHVPLVTGGGPASVTHPMFQWVNTVLGNVKNALHGTYHALKPKYLQRYLSEFC
ncbi:IS1595 transposase, partial [mine drainage metagenome]